MSKVADAFKMPYQDKEAEEFVTFDKHHTADEKHGDHEVYDHLYKDDESDSNESAVLGYD